MRLLRNKAYLMIVVAAMLMLATMLGGLALRRSHASRSSPPAAPTEPNRERP